MCLNIPAGAVGVQSPARAGHVPACRILVCDLRSGGLPTFSSHGVGGSELGNSLGPIWAKMEKHAQENNVNVCCLLLATHPLCHSGYAAWNMP